MAKKKTAAQRAAERTLARERQFAATYITNGRNGMRAYMSVFPSCRENSARAKAPLWLARDSVQDEIRKLTDEAWAREAMGAKEVMARMSRIAKQNIRDYYWQPGELNRAGEATEPGHRKPLSELTEAQTECIKGYKYNATGLLIQEHHDKAQQLQNIAKHHQLLNDKTELEVGGKFIVQWGGDESVG